jgi:hypothetical protein
MLSEGGLVEIPNPQITGSTELNTVQILARSTESEARQDEYFVQGTLLLDGVLGWYRWSFYRDQDEYVLDLEHVPGLEPWWSMPRTFVVRYTGTTFNLNLAHDGGQLSGWPSTMTITPIL